MKYDKYCQCESMNVFENKSGKCKKCHKMTSK